MNGVTTRWWWIRHAPVAWAGVRIYGHADLECDTGDREAFAALAARLPSGAVGVRSHLRRTLRTAEAIAAAGYVLPAMLVEPALAEQGFGAWEGASWEELQTAGDPHLKRFWQDPFEVAPPGGESFRDVMVRVGEVLDRLGGVHAGRDIVAVVHAGTIRAALALALGMTPGQVHAFAIDPLSLTRMDRTEGAWTVRTVNS
ncbi:MAG: histidine phosphatase family protein [Alphaproteobacteria bacterium]